MKKIVIIGGGAAGPKTAAKAKRVNPENQIELYTDENLISYSACGLPYYIEGTVKNINQLIVRTPEEFENHMLKLLTDVSFYKSAQNDCFKIFESQKGAVDFVINKLKLIL